MSLKVDLPEVIALSDKISQGQAKAEASLATVKKDIASLEAMESFKGKSAEVAKYYFAEFHQSIIEAFQQLLIEIDADSNKNISDFLGKVDSSQEAKVYQSYIEEQKETIESTYSDFESLSQEINQTINSVSDLVSVIKPNFHEITTKKNILTRIINDLVQNMGDYSNQADTAKMREMLQHIQLLMSNAQSEKGEGRFTEFYKGDSAKARKKLDKWVESKREKTSLEKLASGGKVVKNIFKYSNYTNVATQGITMYSILKHMGKEHSKALRKSGLHSFSTMNYIRYNNRLAISNIYKLPNKHFMQVFKQVTKQRVNPIQAIKNLAPYSTLPNPSLAGSDFAHKLMKSEFIRSLDLKKFQEFKSLPITGRAKSMFKTFRKELYGNKIKTTKKLINQTNWKKPQTLMKGALDEVKGKTKGLNVLGKIGKLAGPLGAGLHVADNFNEHKGNTQKAIVGSAVDIAGSSVATATGAAIGSAFLPPIGTVVGAGVGIGVSLVLNNKWGKPPKSALDHIKGGTNKAINKIKGWFK